MISHMTFNASLANQFHSTDEGEKTAGKRVIRMHETKIVLKFYSKGEYYDGI